MISTRQYLAAVGFAFVAAWIGFSNFGYAILCLVGAIIFYVAGVYLEGVVDLDQLQERLTGRSAGQPASRTPPAPAPPRPARPRSGPRVQ